MSRRGFRPRRWALLLLLIALLAPLWELLLPAGLSPPPVRRTVVIERGQSLQTIARKLQTQGVIHGTFGFLALARVMRLDRSIKAGQYSFRLGTSVPALLRALARGMYGLDLVTIPEGLTMGEIRDLVARRAGFAPATFDSLARNRAFLDSLRIPAPSIEGWLAPDSYEWLPGTSPEVVMRMMVERTRQRLAQATAGVDSLPGDLDLGEVLTLASIVECEAMMDDERPRIARVYLNRLELGMRLQADPTVAYAHGMKPRSKLLFKHLTLPNAYNTYYVTGLPPGPICSPGLASIDGVIHATPGDRDLFFVARGDGRHMFARTFAEHAANIRLARTLQAALRSLPSAEDTDSTGATAAAAGPPAPTAHRPDSSAGTR